MQGFHVTVMGAWIFRVVVELKMSKFMANHKLTPNNTDGVFILLTSVIDKRKNFQSALQNENILNRYIC